MQYKVITVKWNGETNVCSFCGNKPEYCYIATSHDHTDDVATLCNCGAGMPFSEFFREVRNPTRTLESFAKYL